MGSLVIFEELFFRAYLLQQFQAIFRNIYISTLGVSCLFAVVHSFGHEFSISEYFYFVMVSVLLCLFTALGNGIEIPIGMHLSHNFTILLSQVTPVSFLGFPVTADLEFPSEFFQLAVCSFVLGFVLFVFKQLQSFKLLINNFK